ncbi:MAG: NAD(P)(+) transhydrogenase (Re/Si-specific) subunit alpha [Planctomycetes bacterium]|jgi:NAD(P) transhydrogenase subunit alpha|nr:NAD(P)(+) transhydrogenase (Re/Si-specific) subunit alpha [Planctomycetota bacterium]
MKLAAPLQPADEPRAPLTPAAAKKLVGQGLDVTIEAGLGRASRLSDEAYRDAGATLAEPEGETTAAIWSEADLVVTLTPPTPAQARAMKRDAVLVGMLAPLAHEELIHALAEQHVTSYSLEFVPRITRAQAMDVLSSQANIGGYKAVINAAQRCPKMLPMMITAAGTLAPAKAFIIGAGVAGLQAIATAKRLGAVVEAFDVRAATKEQVESLGARFIELPTAAQNDQATGGYAKEQTDEERQKQTELMAKHVIGADIVVTTAAVFGKAPPLLIPKDVVERMSPGSVIVDLAAAAEHGRGNCELTEPGEVITTDRGVTIDGTLNLPGTVPTHASQAYANNIVSLLGELVRPAKPAKDEQPATEAALTIDLEDDVQKGACITHGGQIVNEMVKKAVSN